MLVEIIHHVTEDLRQMNDFDHVTPDKLWYVTKSGHQRATPAQLSRLLSNKVSDYSNFCKVRIGKRHWPRSARQLVEMFNSILSHCQNNEITHLMAMSQTRELANKIATEFIFQMS